MNEWINWNVSISFRSNRYERECVSMAFLFSFFSRYKAIPQRHHLPYTYYISERSGMLSRMHVSFDGQYTYILHNSNWSSMINSLITQCTTFAIQFSGFSSNGVLGSFPMTELSSYISSFWLLHCSRHIFEDDMSHYFRAGTFICCPVHWPVPGTT